MREAVIVSVARTPIGRAFRGAYNDTQAQTLAGHAIAASVERAGIDPADVDDVVLGCTMPVGSQGFNIGRQGALRAGLPVSVPGMALERGCASGLMAVATAAKQIIDDGMQVVIGGGVESISLAQGYHSAAPRSEDPYIVEHVGAYYMSMLETAEIVAERYGISREAQDEFALLSQQRAAAAQAAGCYAAEIEPITTTMKQRGSGSDDITDRVVTVERDEGIRPATTLEDLAALKPVLTDGMVLAAGKFVTAGNACQLSDGAAALVLMEAKEAERRGIDALGAYRGIAVAGCEPDEMGIGPVYAVPKLLQRHGLKVDDIGIWELNEAFASQVVYCRDRLGIPSERLNVSGGGISLGHPWGMTGARISGHVLLEGRRRAARFGVVTMCIGGGMGAAGLFEIY